MSRALIAGGVVLLAVLGALPSFASDYIVGVGLSFLTFVALTQSWALFSGLSGYVSLGHAVFAGVGAYVMVLCWQAVPFPVAVLLGGGAAGLLALLLGWPCLRVRGPYFVILTFGVAEFVKYVVVSIEAGLGQTGRLLMGTPDTAMLLYGMLVLATVATLLLHFVRRSCLGAGLLALREDEVAAETVGVDTTRAKIAVFALSAIVPGMVGALTILRSTYFEPLQAFSPVTSFTIVTIAVLGGSDEPPGPILGAVFLVLLTELLWAQAPQVYMILLGAILVLFVLFMPEGIYGRLRRVRA
jgi:branched-chain amino acid transport system permease protein